VPSPQANLSGFVDAVNQLCARHAIDLIIPCCEEVFYLAHAHRKMNATLFAPAFETLKTVHSKWTFSILTKQCLIQAPHTQLLVSQADVQAASQDNLTQWVLKPVWSRFASRTLVSPTPQAASVINPTPQLPWVLQRKVTGIELCSYSIAVKGEVVGHTLYRPKYTVGKGAGIYFEPRSDAVIEQFVIDFCKQTQWTGQVGFDFIVSKEGHAVLECNPRATSGVHLLSDVNMPKQVGLAMFLFARPRSMATLKMMCKDWCAAHDVITALGDRLPLLGQILAMIEVAWRSLRSRQNLLVATSCDIEWNGQDLVHT
jgi:hypothetical protein